MNAGLCDFINKGKDLWFWLCRICIAALTVLSIGVATADTTDISERKLVLALELYQLSGMEEQVSAVPTATVEAFDHALSTRAVPQLMAELVPAELLSAVATAFNAPDLSSALVDSIASKMSQVQMEELINWYRSPLGSVVRRAETQHSQLLHPEKFAAFIESLHQSPPTDERLLMLSRLDDAMGVSDSAVDSMINMQLAFALSVLKASPESEQVSPEVIVEQTEAQRPVLLEHYKQLSRQSLLFAYQDLTLDELEQLSAVMELPAGRQYVHAVNEGLETGIFDASAALGDLIVQLYHYQQSAI